MASFLSSVRVSNIATQQRNVIFLVQRRGYPGGAPHPVIDPKAPIPIDPDRPVHPSPPLPPKNKILRDIKDDFKTQQRNEAQIRTYLKATGQKQLLSKLKIIADSARNRKIVTNEEGEDVPTQRARTALSSLRAEMKKFLEANDTDNAYELLATIRRYQLKVSKQEYERILDNFAKNKHPSKVKEVLAFMARDGVKPDEASYMTAVRAYCKIQQYEFAKNTFLTMSEALEPSAKAYEEVMKYFGTSPHVSNIRKAEEIFYTAHRHDVRPTTKTCYSLIRQLVATNYEGDVERAVDVLKFMKTKRIELHSGLTTVFKKHLNVLIEPRHIIRMKKVLVGLQHGGVPDRAFKHYWDIVNQTKWIKQIHRAELAPP